MIIRNFRQFFILNKNLNIKQASIINNLLNKKFSNKSNNDDNDNDEKSNKSINNEILMEQRFKKFYDKDSEIIFDDIDLLLNQKQEKRKNIIIGSDDLNVKLKRGTDGVFDLDEMINLLRNENLKDIVVIKVSKELKYCNYIIICTAISKRQLRMFVEILNKLYKMKKNSNDPYLNLSDDKSDDWRLIDLNNLILHIFMPETREYYDIETLWSIGSKYDDKLNNRHNIINDGDSINLVQDILDRHFNINNNESKINN